MSTVFPAMKGAPMPSDKAMEIMERMRDKYKREVIVLTDDSATLIDEAVAPLVEAAEGAVDANYQEIDEALLKLEEALAGWREEK